MEMLQKGEHCTLIGENVTVSAKLVLGIEDGDCIGLSLGTKVMLGIEERDCVGLLLGTKVMLDIEEGDEYYSTNNHNSLHCNRPILVGSGPSKELSFPWKVSRFVN